MPLWKKPIPNRRLEVYFLYPVLAGVAAAAFQRYASEHWNRLQTAGADRIHIPLQLAVLLIALLALGWCIRWFRPTSLHLKNTTKYPTTLLSVPLGYTLCSLGLPWSEIPPDGLAAGILSVAWPLLVFAAFWWRSTARPLRKSPLAPNAGERPSVGSAQLSEKPLAKILSWAKEIGPIESARDDLFDAKRKAAILADTLQASRGDGSEELRQSVAIRGNFGSGKSSLVNLAREMLERDQPGRFIFVEANCWGLESSAKAKEHVLDLCVEALGDHVDCNRLRRVPSYYGEAINGTPGWAKPAATFALASASPTTELQAFGPILAALDSYLVVVIEDADRNGKDFDTGQILALLHHLRSVPRVSFVVSATRDTAIELFKVAERTIFIEPPDPVLVLKIMNQLRDEALGKAGYLDPDSLYGDRSRPPRPRNLAHEGEFRGWHLPTKLHWAPELAEVVGSIRVLKAVLREFQKTWHDGLWGEVDPDQLLIATSLRHGAPHIFDFLSRYLPEISALPDMDEGGRNSEATKTMLARWQNECAPLPEAKASATLVAQLFPKLALLVGARPPNRPPPLQSVSGAARYWRRIVSGATQPDELSDRLIFALISKLRDNVEAGSQEMACKIEADPRIAAEIVRVESELCCIGQKQRLAVVSQLLGRLRTNASATTTLDDAPWAEITKWIPEMGGEFPALPKWFESEIGASLPTHTSIAAALILKFEDPRLTLPGQEQEPRGVMMLRVLRPKWRGLSPEELAQTFSNKNDGALQTILRPILQHVTAREPLPVEDAWLPALLLRAVRARPDPMLPLTVFAFKWSSSRRPDLHKGFFSAQAVDRFFGRDSRLFYSTIVASAEFIPEGPSSWLIEDAIAEARGELSNTASD
jgi:hypothetical protein